MLIARHQEDLIYDTCRGKQRKETNTHAHTYKPTNQRTYIILQTLHTLTINPTWQQPYPTIPTPPYTYKPTNPQTYNLTTSQPYPTTLSYRKPKNLQPLHTKQYYLQ